MDSTSRGRHTSPDVDGQGSPVLRALTGHKRTSDEQGGRDAVKRLRVDTTLCNPTAVTNVALVGCVNAFRETIASGVFDPNSKKTTYAQCANRMAPAFFDVSRDDMVMQSAAQLSTFKAEMLRDIKPSSPAWDMLLLMIQSYKLAPTNEQALFLKFHRAHAVDSDGGVKTMHATIDKLIQGGKLSARILRGLSTHPLVMDNPMEFEKAVESPTGEVGLTAELLASFVAKFKRKKGRLARSDLLMPPRALKLAVWTTPEYKQKTAPSLSVVKKRVRLLCAPASYAGWLIEEPESDFLLSSEEWVAYEAHMETERGVAAWIPGDSDTSDESEDECSETEEDEEDL